MFSWQMRQLRLAMLQEQPTTGGSRIGQISSDGVQCLMFPSDPTDSTVDECEMSTGAGDIVGDNQSYAAMQSRFFAANWP